jgi:hypothetical protein
VSQRNQSQAHFSSGRKPPSSTIAERRAMAVCPAMKPPRKTDASSSGAKYAGRSLQRLGLGLTMPR